jgi:hypothetical protein
MNKNSFTVTVVVLLLIAAAVYYERNRSAEIQTSLATMASERESLTRQVKNLTNVVAELKQRSAPPPVEVPRVELPPPKPVVQREEVTATPMVSITAPQGWSKNGSKPGAYVVGVDKSETYAGLPSAYVRSIESSVDGFGGMMQMSAPDDLIGKRVRLSGWVKTEDANDGGGHLWLRVDGKQSGQSLQFDNMDGRAIKGTTGWQQYSVVVDVPTEASALAYGFFVQGTGKMWVSGTKIEPVSADVPSTNLIKPRTQTLPKTPVNLNFGEGP